MRSFALYLILALVLCSLGGTARGWAADPLSTVNGDRQEISFGDLAADALCADSGATISLVAAVSFKPGTVPAGGATREQIASLLQTPEESWGVCKLTGDQLRQALERSLSRLPLPSLAFLQVSGLTVTYDPSQPRDQRIVSLTCSSGPVQAAQSYEVVMPLSLCQGGSGYFQIFDQDSLIRRGTTGLADAIGAFLQAHPNRAYSGQGRLLASSQPG
jgi:hypothetical protein